MFKFLMGMGVGLIVGWNVLTQPQWVQNLTPANRKEVICNLPEIFGSSGMKIPFAENCGGFFTDFQFNMAMETPP